MRKFLLCFACALKLGGALMLLWYGYLEFDIFRTQKAASRIIYAQDARSKEDAYYGSDPRMIVIVPPRAGEPVARIEIPRLRLSVMVVEGTAANTLRAAAGHIRGTALPGTRGNICIAAHRDTLFRPLRNVQPRDEILLTTSYGKFRYVVDSTRIVKPNDVEVLRNTNDWELTLITCYPFYYAGPAPKRFVVHAQRA